MRMPFASKCFVSSGSTHSHLPEGVWTASSRPHCPFQLGYFSESNASSSLADISRQPMSFFSSGSPSTSFSSWTFSPSSSWHLASTAPSSSLAVASSFVMAPILVIASSLNPSSALSCESIHSPAMRQSDAIRRNQAQSGAIRRTQTQSGSAASRSTRLPWIRGRVSGSP